MGTDMTTASFAQTAHGIAQATALGVAIAHPDHAAVIFSVARVEDFDPPFRQAAEAIHRLRLNQKHIDQLAVCDEMTRSGTISQVGGTAFVFDLMNYSFGGPPSADYATEVIANCARRRRLWKTGTQLAAASERDESDPLRLAQAAGAEIQGVVDSIDADGDVLTPTLREFLSTEDAPYDWVIPGLLERGDRLMLTGLEGLGKSALLRMLAMTAASGIHPFTGAAMPPQRVLYVDCENGVPKLRRELRGLAAQGKRLGCDPAGNMWVEARPEGLDLARVEDETWLVRHVASLQPQLLITGPVYRLHAGNPNDEESARQVARVLDRCRAAANCALVLEAHAGHGKFGMVRDVRPIGSSLWLRWPEYGYGIRPAEGFTSEHRRVEFTSWRGDREAREWPDELESGGSWPWRVAVPL